MGSYISSLKQEFAGYNAQRLSKDLMAGLTVTAVALPLALAFGVSCGADAGAGLITAIIAGLVISLLSGASYQISGPTGAMSAVLITIVIRYQLQGVFVASLMAGIILLLAGIFRLGKLVAFIPMPVVTGFTSGIAIIIALGQIDNFFGTTSQGETALQKLASYAELGFHPNLQAVLIGSLVVAVMLIWPKKWNAKVPSSLVGIILAAIVSNLFHLDIATVGEIPRTLFPENRLSLSALNFDMVKNLISPAFTIAALGMIESLLCGASGSRMKNEPFHADQELIAQGVGNILIPFFGGVPATAAIARTSVAIKSGCQTRLTGVFHALGLLASMFLLGPVMATLPLAALAGVLMVTAWRMNEWHSIRYIFGKGFKSAMLKFLLTMAATVIFDLTVAILLGVIASTFIFVAHSSNLIVDCAKVENSRLNTKGTQGLDIEAAYSDATVVYVTGPIFFGNIAKLTDRLAQIEQPSMLIFSMRGVSSLDATAAQILRDTLQVFKNHGVSLRFCGVQPAVREMMAQAEIEDIIGEKNFFWSVDKALLDDEEALV